MTKRLARTLLLALLVSFVVPAHSAEVHVAVAANFAPTLNALASAFEAEAGDRVIASVGSTGKLYAQIKHGAPYDVFLSADTARPRRLEAEGLVVQGSRFVYARGELVLWSADAKRVDTEGRVLATGNFRHLALANPKTAPYGAAARAALASLGVWEKWQDRMVFGEDVGQTLQFVQTGNAELGFIARSQLLRLQDAARGSVWRVPAALYPPIEQEAVLLTRARGNDAARRFLTFVKGARARAIIVSDGYAVP